MNVVESHSLSRQQERLWRALSQPGSLQAHCGLWLHGPLDERRLRASLEAVVARHEILRTRFRRPPASEVPVQVVADEPQITWQEIDLRGSALSAEEQIDQLIARNGERPFDLEAHPPVRATLARLADRARALVLHVPALCTDTAGLAIAAAELREAYAGNRPGPDAVQYADCCAGQGRAGAAGAPPGAAGRSRPESWGLPFRVSPTDGPQRFELASLPLRCDDSLAKSLADAAAGLGSNVESWLLTCWRALLWRLAGRRELVLGAVCDRRPDPSQRGAVGRFARARAVGGAIDPRDSFDALVARTDLAAFAALEGDGLGCAPAELPILFQHCEARSPADVGALSFQIARLSDCAERFGLALCAASLDGLLRLELCYDRALFEGDDVEWLRALAAQYEALLEQTLRDPRRAVGSVDLVTGEAAQRLPDPRRALPRSEFAGVPQLVCEWAARTPDAEAIRSGSRSVSYAELAGAAREIAARLADAGMGSEQVVAVDGPRSFGFVASLLAVWMAGGVALPLDRGLPVRRRQVMLRESRASALVCVGGEGGVGEGLPVLFAEPDPVDGGDNPVPADPPTAAADAPAYVFFTSGTSGVPKGVRGCHGGLAHFLDWQRQTFSVSPGDRAAHVTGLSFDVVLREIFLPLTSGATLCIPGAADGEDPVRLLRWLAAAQITLLHTVPTLAEAWLAEGGGRAALPSLRAVFFAGEPLSRSLVARWRARFGDSAEIVNLYGPTETTLAKCWYVVPQRPPAAQLPVGSPLPESQALVLSPERRLCGIGEPGEVAIRTPWRSLGYVNEAHPFVPNPFADDPDDEIYPTGDRGRFRPDGTLELLGRLDDQLKIRGVRVEPAEVTALLEDHPEVRAACVLARKDESGPRLVAFAVTSEPRPDLRGHLARALPDAMIPSEFVFLDALPRTANGKVNRAALLALRRGPARRAPAAPARSDMERAVAEIWEKLLGVADVGAGDDFFALGGHSLLALTLVSRLCDRFAAEVSLTDIFECPTVAALAQRLESLSPDPAAAVRAPAVATAHDGDLPLSSAQRQLWFQCQLEGEGGTSYNVPIAIAVRGPLDVAVLKRCLSAIVRRHDVLRARFPVTGGVPQQRISPTEELLLPVVNLDIPNAGDRERELRRLAEQQATTPFDLARGRLLRALLVRRARDSHVLHLTVHHLVFDGWSRWLLIAELGALYAALRDGRPPRLPPLEAQYSDYVLWKRDHPPDDADLDYWRSTLAGAEPLRLPADRPLPDVPSYRGASESRELSAELCGALLAFGRREGATLYMVLLAAFQLLLSRWSGQSDVTVGTPVANRPRPEFEHLLGCFLNTLAMRTDLSGDPSFRQLVARVRKVALDAFAHQDVPFERLVEELRPQRDPRRHPIFDVMFNLVNVPRNPVELTGLELSYPELCPPESRFAFTLYAREVEGRLDLRIVYQTSLFSARRMSLFLEQFEELLRAAIADSERRISSLAPDPWAPRGRRIGAPPAGTGRRRGAPAFVSPRTPVERELADIWCALLEIDRVSVHDNFFDLGGHSLLATQVLARMRSGFELDLPLRILFEHQTIAELALAVTQHWARALPAKDVLRELDDLEPPCGPDAPEPAAEGDA